MTIASLLYISRASFPLADAESTVAGIVATARERNPALGVTGALLFTGTYFAQVLEGDRETIDALMASISRDPRHDQSQVVDRDVIPKRRFADWSMAYFGPSQFVSRHVTRLLNTSSQAQRRRASEWLTELLVEFATD